MSEIRAWKWDLEQTLKRYEEKIQEALKQVNELLDYLEGDEPYLTESEVEEAHEIAEKIKKVLTDE